MTARKQASPMQLCAQQCKGCYKKQVQLHEGLFMLSMSHACKLQATGHNPAECRYCRLVFVLLALRDQGNPSSEELNLHCMRTKNNRLGVILHDAGHLPVGFFLAQKDQGTPVVKSVVCWEAQLRKHARMKTIITGNYRMHEAASEPGGPYCREKETCQKYQKVL